MPSTRFLVISAAEMEDKKELIVSGLKGVTNENNNKVKKVFAQVVIAMGHHGYMELEGGSQMIEFVVSQCSLPDDPPVSFFSVSFIFVFCQG